MTKFTISATITPTKVAESKGTTNRHIIFDKVPTSWLKVETLLAKLAIDSDSL